jgi:hypothetical protein
MEKTESPCSAKLVKELSKTVRIEQNNIIYNYRSQ